MEFAALIAPVPVERFLADHYGKRPLHIRADGDTERGALVGWARLNALLAMRLHWSEAHIRLLIDGREIAPSLFMEEISTLDGRLRRASPAKVDHYLGLGASLVASGVHHISPEIAEAAAALSRQFAASAEANIYCSFQGVQAFPTHFDSHEVFAIQGEGEKLWRIYSGRSPLALDKSVPKAVLQERMEAARGEIQLEALMRPGDLLYIPRGFFHDAEASSAESLHLTLAVSPRSGRSLFRLLDLAAARDPAFEAWLPDAREAEGEPLRRHLDALAGRLAEIMRSPAFLDAVAEEQRKQRRPLARPALPARAEVRTYARTRRAATLEWDDAGALVRLGGDMPETQRVGAAAEELAWLLVRPIFSAQELFGQFPHRTPEEIDTLLAQAEAWGLIRPAKPARA